MNIFSAAATDDRDVVRPGCPHPDLDRVLTHIVMGPSPTCRPAVRHAIAPDLTMPGFPARPKARPTGRLSLAALSRLVLVPACATGPPVVPARPELAARILDVLEVDPTTTR